MSVLWRREDGTGDGRMQWKLAQQLTPPHPPRNTRNYNKMDRVVSVAANESTITSTAGGGTMLLEMGTLSRLTGVPDFEVTRARLSARRFCKILLQKCEDGSHPAISASSSLTLASRNATDFALRAGAQAAALRAVRALWARRSGLGLLGAHLDVVTGERPGGRKGMFWMEGCCDRGRPKGKRA